MINNESLLAVSAEKDIGNIIKPLVSEIHLFDTYVAGTSHLSDKSVLDTLTEGCTLTLRREDNKFDEMAIILFSPDGRKVGYVPRKDNLIFARLMDAGKLLTAKVTELKPRTSDFMQISIGIYLVDI